MDFILVFFMSMDAFFACFSLSTKQIRISFGARIVIATVGAVCLLASLCISNILCTIISEKIFHIISSLALIIIAFYCFTDSHSPDMADIDHSGLLSATEALFLAVPLSLDSLFTGLSINTTIPYILLIFSFLCGLIATFLGEKSGTKLIKIHGKHASIFSGIILMFIAGAKLIIG